MALVLDPSDNLTVLGIITLEDVLETLLESEIYDGANSYISSIDLAQVLFGLSPNSPIISFHLLSLLLVNLSDRHDRE